MNTQASVSSASGGSTNTQPSLFTIGYGSRTMDEFIAVLLAHGIQEIIDVRSAPYSKFKPEFSKQFLEHCLQTRGVRYRFLGDSLGGQPADPDCYLEGKVDYTKLQQKSFFQAGLDQLRSTLQPQIKAALMCSEGRPEQCHRSKLIGEALAALGIPIAHIDEDGGVRSHAEVIHRLTGGQLDLFGQPAFTSRKRYGPGGSQRTG